MQVALQIGRRLMPHHHRKHSDLPQILIIIQAIAGEPIKAVFQGFAQCEDHENDGEHDADHLAQNGVGPPTRHPSTTSGVNR
ncbi:hypothetical protein [Frigidibacter mobilis]|uniref:hypothetical protein n=1 Tax=Frigidibacter mobilis TaxID=1335048 RepID=UPI003AAD98E5